MSRYASVASSPTPPSRRSSLASIRRPSFSSFRLGSQRSTQMPDPDEMDAAFDGPDDEGETHGLLGQSPGERTVPGDYDFERDYVSARRVERL